MKAITRLILTAEKEWRSEFIRKQTVLKKALILILKNLCAKQDWSYEILSGGAGFSVSAPAQNNERNSATINFKMLTLKDAAGTLEKYRYYWPIIQGIKRPKNGGPILYVNPNYDSMKLNTLSGIKKLTHSLPEFVAEVKGAEYRHMD
jgi:hypothetical protein